MPDTGPEPERIENAEGPLEADGPEDPAGSGDPDGLEDEAKRKFREALERKRTLESAAGAGTGGRAGGKVQGPHGPASSRRSFRRRGGG
jgi:hypothetical protein